AFAVRAQEAAQLVERGVEGQRVRIVAGLERVLVHRGRDQRERGGADEIVEVGEEPLAGRDVAQEVERWVSLADIALVEHDAVVTEVLELEEMERRDDRRHVLVLAEHAQRDDEQRKLRRRRTVIAGLVDIDHVLAKRRHARTLRAVYDTRRKAK